MKVSEVTIVDGKRVVVDASLNVTQLLKQFPDQCATGKPFVVAIAPATDKRDTGRELYNVFFAQQRAGDFGQDLDSDPDRVGLGSMWAEFLVDTPIIRAMQVMDKRLIDKLGVDYGVVLNLEGNGRQLNIHQIDSIIPENDAEELRPRLTKADEHGTQYVMVNANGRPIFRREFLTPDFDKDYALDQPRAYRRSKITYQTYLRETVARQDERAAKQAAMLAAQQPVVAAPKAEDVAIQAAQ